LDSDNGIGKDYIDKIYEIPEWDIDTIYTPSFAMPKFDFRAYEGLTITKESVADYIDKPMFEVMLNAANYFVHPFMYLEVFDDTINPVTSDSIFQCYNWLNEGKKILCIPMRIGSNLVGLQMIDEEGNKKFLYGQRTSFAQFVFDNKGIHVLCEGYATGLSIRAVLKQLKRRYTLHICFSANNMEKVASTLPGGFVVADNDLSGTGEKVAKKIGWAYYMPPAGDFNDFLVDQWLFNSSQALGKSMPLA